MTNGGIILGSIQDMLDEYNGDLKGSIGLKEAYERLKHVGAKLLERTMVCLFLPSSENNPGFSEIMGEYADLQTYIMKYAANVDNETVGFEEFTKRLEQLGSNEPEKGAAWIFNKADTNRDKLVSYDELKELAKTLPEMKSTTSISDIRSFFR